MPYHRPLVVIEAKRTCLDRAKRNFVTLLPDMSVMNLCEEKDDYMAHCALSIYQTMMNCIDSVEDEGGRLFTAGHFDLVIRDKAHC